MKDEELNDARELVDKAFELAREGKTREAIRVYDELLSKLPISALYDQRGVLYHECGEFHKAILDFTDGIGLSHDDPDLYLNRGNAYLRLGAYRVAIDDYDRAIELAPDSKHALNGRAQAAADLGRTQDAISDWQRAIQLDPNFVNAHFNKGLFLYEEGNLEEALRCLNLAAQCDPNDEMIFRVRGDVLLAMKKYSVALGDYELAVKLAPSKGHGYRCLAWILSTCPDPEVRNGTLALEHATKSCELTDWTSGKCLESLAAAYAENGSFKQAIRYQNAAIELLSSRLRERSIERLQTLQQSKALREG